VWVQQKGNLCTCAEVEHQKKRETGIGKSQKRTVPMKTWATRRKEKNMPHQGGYSSGRKKKKRTWGQGKGGNVLHIRSSINFRAAAEQKGTEKKGEGECWSIP